MTLPVLVPDLSGFPSIAMPLQLHSCHCICHIVLNMASVFEQNSTSQDALLQTLDSTVLGYIIHEFNGYVLACNYRLHLLG